MREHRLLYPVLAALVVIAACGNGDTAITTTTASTSMSTSVTTTTPTVVTTSTTNATTTTTIAVTTTTTTAPVDELPDGLERTDYLTFAQGAVPAGFAIEGPGENLKNSVIIQAIDGNRTPRVFVGNATDDTTIEMTFALPSLTSFDRLAVPQILEVPGPSVTFFRNIEVLGAVGSLDGPFVTLAGGTLATHESDGEVTELQIVSDESVDFVKIRLSGGINIIEDLSGFEFSELIGNGTQQPVALVEGFTGIWDAKLPDIDRSIGLIELDQDGAIVTGCFGTTDLTGSVTGNLVRMTGVDRFDSVLSAYIFA